MDKFANAAWSVADARHDENVLATVNTFDPIPYRIARELGILQDCVLYRAGWYCHQRLNVRYQFPTERQGE